MKKTNPNFEKKTSNVLKADRTIHRVTFNPNTASPVQALRVPVPKFDGGVVQDLFHSSLTWQLVFPQKIIS